MKKLSLILAGTVLFGSFAFASHVVKQDSKAPVAKQDAKPAAKPTKAEPGKAATTKTAPAATKGTKKVPAKKGTPVGGTAK